MYDVTRSSNAYKPKKVHVKAIDNVFRLFASTKREEAAVPFAGSNLPGCFPLPGRVLLTRVWPRGCLSLQELGLEMQMNLLFDIPGLTKEKEVFNKKAHLHHRIIE